MICAGELARALDFYFEHMEVEGDHGDGMYDAFVGSAPSAGDRRK